MGSSPPQALRTIGQVSTKYARDTADLTDRQNVQLHWVRIEDVPDIWEAVEGVGLSTAEACGDVPRVILGSPVAGISSDEIIDGTPAIREIIERYIGSEEFSNLPRKFKTAISGSPRQDVAHEIHDIAFRVWSTPSTARGSTSGSAGDCPPTRCSASGSAPGSRWTRSRTSGRASSRSSAITATAGCATAPG